MYFYPDKVSKQINYYLNIIQTYVWISSIEFICPDYKLSTSSYIKLASDSNPLKQTFQEILSKFQNNSGIALIHYSF